MIGLQMARSQRSRIRRRKRNRGIPKLLGYILSLDWDEETLSFFIHGLWPEYSQHKTPPETTTADVEQELRQRTLNRLRAHWQNWSKKAIQKFLQHEWKKHGTLSNMSSNEYFKKTLEVYKAALNKALQGMYLC